jgi:hypothetical protein
MRPFLAPVGSPEIRRVCSDPQLLRHRRGRGSAAGRRDPAGEAEVEEVVRESIGFPDDEPAVPRAEKD